MIGAKVAGHLGLCLVDQGRPDEAIPLLLENLERARKYHLTGGILAPHLHRCRGGQALCRGAGPRGRKSRRARSRPRPPVASC